MTRCPWFPSHDVSPDPDGLAVGDVGTCTRDGLQYVVVAVDPYQVARDEQGSASVVFALAQRRKLPPSAYQKLLELPEVARALRAQNLDDGARGKPSAAAGKQRSAARAPAHSSGPARSAARSTRTAPAARPSRRAAR